MQAGKLASKEGRRTPQIASLIVDLHCSVAKLARHAALHKPSLIVGEGQGAIVAAAYGHPGCLETVLATRNIQLPEIPDISQAWGNVRCIVIHAPRLSKKGVQLENLKKASPDMFAPYPVPSRRVMTWKDMKTLHYLETKQFFEAAAVEVVPAFGDLPLYTLLQEPPQLMWEHSGKCLCGKRSYLFSQCRYCLQEEALEQERRRQEEQFGEGPRPGSMSDPPSPGAPEPIDEEGDGDLVAPIALPNTLPVPRIRTGAETDTVVFVTDTEVHIVNMLFNQDYRQRMSWARDRGPQRMTWAGDSLSLIHI